MWFKLKTPVQIHSLHTHSAPKQYIFRTAIVYVGNSESETSFSVYIVKKICTKPTASSYAMFMSVLEIVKVKLLPPSSPLVSTTLLSTTLHTFSNSILWQYIFNLSVLHNHQNMLAD